MEETLGNELVDGEAVDELLPDDDFDNGITVDDDGDTLSAPNGALKGANLSRPQIEFLEVYVECPFMSDAEICRQIGIKPHRAKQWKQSSPAFRRALAKEHRRAQVVANISRRSVINGLLEAKDIAKDQRKPGGMISAWREIGRLCGFYEPDRKEIVISIDGEEALKKVKAMTREQLIEHLNAPPEREQLPILEGVYEDLGPDNESAAGLADEPPLPEFLRSHPDAPADFGGDTTVVGERPADDECDEDADDDPT